MAGLLAAARIFAPWAGVAVLGLGLAWLNEASSAGRPGAPHALARGFVLSSASLIVLPLVAALLAWACAGGQGDIASLSLFSANASGVERQLALGLFLLPIAGFLIARLIFATGASLGCAVAIAAGSLLLAIVSWPVAFAGGLAVGALVAFAWDSLEALASAVAGASGLALILADITAGRTGLVAVFLALDGGLALALLAARGGGAPLMRLIVLTLLAVAPAFALLGLAAHAGGLSLTTSVDGAGVRARLVFVLAVLPGAVAGCGAAAMMMIAARRRLLIRMRTLQGRFVRHPVMHALTATGLFLLALIASAVLAALSLAIALGAAAAFAHVGAMAGRGIDPLSLADLNAQVAHDIAPSGWWFWAIGLCIFLPAAARLTVSLNRVLSGPRRARP